MAVRKQGKRAGARTSACRPVTSTRAGLWAYAFCRSVVLVLPYYQ